MKQPSVGGSIQRPVDEYARKSTSYVQAGNGTLNAFAANALRQGFTVVYSDLFANTLPDNEPALRFIVSHELGHIRCHHTRLGYRMATCFIA